MFRRAVQRHSGEIPGDAVTRALTAQSSVHGVYDVLRGGRSRGKSSHRKVYGAPVVGDAAAGLVADYVAAMAPVDPRRTRESCW